MTAEPPVSGSIRLPLWRAIAGFAVLAILATLLVVAGLVYLDNFRLDRYMRSLAADPASGALSDSTLTADILERAKQLRLPVQETDITVTRAGGRPGIQIGKYMVETDLVKMDLRMPAAAAR